jgi:hypothetical protein
MSSISACICRVEAITHSKKERRRRIRTRLSESKPVRRALDKYKAENSIAQELLRLCDMLYSIRVNKYKVLEDMIYDE